jgi:HSP20 family protein
MCHFDCGKGIFHKECCYGFISRSIPLGTNVNWEKAQAKYKKGVLNITIPEKVEKQESVKITVQ